MKLVLLLKGNETINEIYKLTLETIQQFVKVTAKTTDDAGLHRLKVEILELLAIVENESTLRWEKTRGIL